MRSLRSSAQRGSAAKVILGILGGLVVLVLVAAVVTVWAVRQFVQIEVTQTESGKSVRISTPFGEMEVEDAADVADRLKLPVYPGADPEDEGGVYRVRGGVEGEEGGLTLIGAHFRTRDELDQVERWYREQLGEEYQRHEGEKIEIFDGHDWPAEWNVQIRGVAFVHETRSRVRGVLLEPKHRGVEIGLFELQRVTPQ